MQYKWLFTTTLVFILFPIFHRPIFAEDHSCPNRPDDPVKFTVSSSPNNLQLGQTGTLTFEVTSVSGLNPETDYFIDINGRIPSNSTYKGRDIKPGTKFTYSISESDTFNNNTTNIVLKKITGGLSVTEIVCDLSPSYSFADAVTNYGSCTITTDPPVISPNTVSSTQGIIFTVKNLFAPAKYTASLDGNYFSTITAEGEDVIMRLGAAPEIGTHVLTITPFKSNEIVCKLVFNSCENPNDCPIPDQDGGIDKAPTFDLCANIPPKNVDDRNKCAGCYQDGGMWTGLGCIKTDAKAFIGQFIQIALGIAGGIALLLMVYGAFLIAISSGDPKKSSEGKEIITGTIAGLLFIIFSVFLLQLIGVDILNVPGF